MKTRQLVHVSYAPNVGQLDNNLCFSLLRFLIPSEPFGLESQFHIIPNKNTRRTPIKFIIMNTLDIFTLIN